MNTNNTDKKVQAVGKPMNRVDGRLKVMGEARYSAEMPVANATYGVLIQSTIAKGQISQIDSRAAAQIPGVLAIITHQNAPQLPQQQDKGQKGGAPVRKLSLLQDNAVYYSGQPIGVVVANTFESAMQAAALIRVSYQESKPSVDMDNALNSTFSPASKDARDPIDLSRGDLNSGLTEAVVRVDETYTTPTENHNPMEPHATLAVWEGERLTLYDATQGVFGTQRTIANTLGIPPENVRVINHFLGGGFGCKGSTWSHVVLAAMAARQVRKPVRLVLGRQQMFGPVGFRPQTVQHVLLGATREGKLTAIQHESINQTSSFDDWVETSAVVTRMLYACPNVATSHRLVRLDTGTPCQMRAPGEAPGTFALESAMDELAYALKMDPIALRLHNYADVDPESGKPWSSKSLRECYHLGAERFGWERRNPQPRSMRDGNTLVGWGMATAAYPTHRASASALARILADGTAFVESGTQDIGTGTYTIMTQIAADALGLPPERVRFELGQTDMPNSPVSGGSQTAASTGSAVQMAAVAVRSKVIQMAIADAASPLQGAREQDCAIQNGRLFLKNNPSKAETYAAILARHGLQMVEAQADAQPGDEKQQFSMHAFGSHFAEVHVDPELCEVRVARWVGVFGAGRILNIKTARNQLMGGIVNGIGMALMEQTVADPNRGRIVTADLAEYLVPVNADVPQIDIFFLDEQDPHVNPIGVKGIGEIGITGTAAAIANAVYHATGKRVRDIPITLDKLM